VVTGFGPFRDHTTNASWEAVRQLPSFWEDSNHELLVEEIPVQYSFVSEQVPDKWAAMKPILFVHVGVSSRDKQVTLEQVAHNSGYCGLDVQQCCPSDHLCVPEGPEELKTCLDLAKVESKVNAQSLETELGVEVCLSKDAGRYLCDFVYYKSLHGSGGRSLFIHVPPVGEPYTAPQLTRGILMVLQAALEQL